MRKTVLAVHVLSSVGWFGAVAAFLALALVGFSSGDASLVTGVYVAARLIAWWVILPLGVLAFLSGVIESVGTPWGLVRYWWVLIKLVLTTGSLVLFLVHLQVVDRAADHGMSPDAAHRLEALDGMRLQLVVDSGAALVVLVIATLLSILKPRGLTPFGAR